MLTARENFFETIKQDGKPDRLVNQFEDMVFFPVTPVSAFVRGKRYPGMEPLRDKFGTLVLWPENQFAAMPHVTDDERVIHDISKWQEYVSFPELVANASDPTLWEEVAQGAETVRAEGKLSMALFPTGVFEQMHFLTGFTDLFVGMAVLEEETAALAHAIGEWRFEYAKLIVDNMKPDIMLSHDDWGSKTSLFVSPEMWRRFIKPTYEKTYRYLRDNGVIVMHHADSYLQPIVEDMVELGIDVWQGVLPTNDICAIQTELNGRMALMGGIDSGTVDRIDSSEEEIRAEVRRACAEYGPGGHFIPCITYGGPGTMFPHSDPLISDEISCYNSAVYGVKS